MMVPSGVHCSMREGMLALSCERVPMVAMTRASLSGAAAPVATSAVQT